MIFSANGVFPYNLKPEHNKLNAFLIFMVRLMLGCFFGVLLIRIFHPEAGIIHALGLGLILVGLAYGFEYFRKGRSKKEIP